MRISNRACLFGATLLLAFACNSPTQQKQHEEQLRSDSLKESQIQAAAQAEKSSYNAFARFIAGLRQVEKNKYSTLEQDSVWMRHASRMDYKWATMTKKRTARLNEWASTEVPQAMRQSKVLFYPFSGADILNANLLFPATQSYYLFGLEPVGYLPDVLLNANGRDTLQRYFNSLDVSLNAITNYSFFRTNSMKVDFKADELNGTIHLLLLFLSRNHHTIANIRYVYVDDQGIQHENTDRKIHDNDGVEIVYHDTTHIAHTITYYSVDLSNLHLSKNKGMQAYITGLGTFNTYLKAASYLMHNASFSEIRNYILNQSHYVLQDDSGIPFKFFTRDNQWNLNLFGEYVPPISLFSNYYQKDLDSAYHDSVHHQSKPLNFGIGYNFYKSNLMLFEKK